MIETKKHLETPNKGGKKKKRKKLFLKKHRALR